MRIKSSISALALGMIIADPILAASPGSAAPDRPVVTRSTPALSGHIHAEVARLVRQTAGLTTALPDQAAESVQPAANGEEITVLELMTVTDRIPPDLTPPRETRAEAFFRTGTIAEHVGKKVTTRFWFSSGQGLMLSFDF